MFLIFGFFSCLFYEWRSSSNVTTKIHRRFNGRKETSRHKETRAATDESTALVYVSIYGSLKKKSAFTLACI
jgi:hypothetical protein